jgi:dolichol-phosphate mannosyltransferase
MPLELAHHKVNQGLSGALRTGFSTALKLAEAGDVIVTMDADDTHSPGTIPSLLQTIADGYDVVIASRYQVGSRVVGVPVNRLILTSLARWLFKLIMPIPGVRDYTCGYRAYRYEALKKASDYYGQDFVSEQGFSSMVDVLLKMRRFGFVMGEVPFLLRYDQKQGKSKMQVSRTARKTIMLLLKRRFGGY